MARWSLAVVALLVAGYVGWVVYSFVKLQGAIYQPLPPTRTPVAAVAPTDDGPALSASPTPDYLKNLPKGRINVLVLGTDKRPNDSDHYPRSDTILLASLDTISRTVHIMAIPRDLVMEVPGYGENKVNAAYLLGEYYDEPGGGQALAVQTVSDFFGVPIDYYVTVNFEGFRKVVDTLGGVTINVPYQMDDYNYPSDDEGDPYGELYVHFDAGPQRMDGKTALRYARTRHADNDFMRSKRQLQLIVALREEAMSLDLIPVLPSLMEQLGGMVETNIPFDQQLALAQLGYQIEPSNIITSAIDSEMIYPTTLPDGSEGLRLDWEAAQPMLDEFFGTQAASPETTDIPTKEAGVTPQRGAGSQVAAPTRTSTPASRRTPTPIPTR